MYGRAAAAVLILIILVVLIFLKYRKRKMGAFRAEVVIETLRLWREMIEDYRRTQPEDSMSRSMTVAEEAAYMAVHGPLRKQVWRIARANVKKMHKYHVQEYRDGKAVGDWQVIYANSDQEAAEKVVGRNIRCVGKLGELRARVRPVGDLKNETAFYSLD